MEDNNTGWVKLFHSSGAQVTIPLSLDNPITSEQATALNQSVTTLIAAGLSVSPESLELGEQIIDISAVVRRSKTEGDGSDTPVLDLYFPRGNFRWVSKYVNSPDDIAAFEAATGLKLSALPVFDGNPIELGKKPKVDERFVIHMKAPAKLVWKPNQRYEGPEDKKNPKRLFVRWASQAPTNGNSKPTAAPKNDTEAETKAEVPDQLAQAYSVVIPTGIKIPEPLIGKTLGQAKEDPRLGAAVLLYLSGKGTNNAGEAFEPENDEQKAVKEAATIIVEQDKVALPKSSKK